MSDKRWTLQHEAGHAAAAAAASRAAAEHVTPDDLAAAMGGMATRAPAIPLVEEEPLEDGWERVPRRGNRR